MKKKIILYALIVLGFLVLSYAFVPQVLGGKIVNQSDISGYQGMSREVNAWNKAHPDDQTAWTDSMFGGMPSIAFNTPKKGDWTQTLYDLLLTGKRPATYLFISLLGAFLLMLSLGISPLIAVGGAIAVTFCSYNFQIIQVGHNTKMQAIAFLPWVLAAVIFTYRSAVRKQKWLLPSIFGASLFGLALSFQIKANHPQISYYLALMILLYVLVLFIWLVCSAERRKSIGRFFAASALLLVIGGAGIAANSNKLIPVWEYTQYSMRGGNTSTGGSSKGLDLEYATAWSYGWEELPNLMIPNYNGGSSAGAVNPKKSQTIQLLRKYGQQNTAQIAKALPMYWGPQPFTAGPMYMGAITVFLFVLGLFLYRGKEKWWLVAATVLAVFLSLGNHFMAFTRFFYNCVPLYNKFRTVSMALVVLQFTLPMLGFLVLDRIVSGEGVSREEFRRKGLVSLAITGGFCLLCALVPSIAGDFVAASDAAQQEILADAFALDRRALLVADAWRSLIFIGLAFALLYWGFSVPASAAKTFASHPDAAASRRRTAAILVCVLVLADLFVAGKRYLNSDHFTTPRSFAGQFAKRPVDAAILEDTDPSYRVLDLTVNVFNDSHPSYWHKNVGGYSPAKMQIYQSYIDNHLNGEIAALYDAFKDADSVEKAQEALPQLPCLSKLNCRYIILDDNAAPVVNTYARGPVWFEDPQAGQIEMTSYAPNELRYRYSADKEARAVFSEVYYPAGWSLKLEDGKELDIELSDELLRSAVLPAGGHELVMRFDPQSYRTGEGISRASSILLILLVLGSAACMIWKSERKNH